jgi:hypothetical protein
MTQAELLNAVVERVAAGGPHGRVVFGADEVSRWPKAALDLLVDTGLLKVAEPAHKVECRGCERRCLRRAIRRAGTAHKPTQWYVTCPWLDDVGPITIPPRRLKRWISSPIMIADVLARGLGLPSGALRSALPILIGAVPGEHGRRKLTLDMDDGLILRAASRQIKLSELLYWDGSKIALDRPAIEQMLLAPTDEGIDREGKPSSRRQIQKLETATRHEDWHREYRRRRRERPDLTNTAIAKAIAKSEFGHDCSFETIRKNMKLR